MARRATWLFLLTLGSAASACSLITSWDDVRLGAIGSDAAVVIDGGATDSGADVGTTEAGTVDAGSDASCVPGTALCVDGTSSGGALGPELYSCNDAGTYDRPVACLHDCVHGGTADNGVDYCSCNPGDTYCGGDNVIGDPNSLYECGVGGPPTLKEKCSLSCVVHPGANDQCNL